MKNEQLIRKWLTDRISEDEERHLKKTVEYAEIEKIWDGLKSATPPWINVPGELQRFHSSRKKLARGISIDWHQRAIWIAASVILISIIGYLIVGPSVETGTTLSESLKAVYLPDSSVVTLNKGSEMAYEVDAWPSSREVHLIGEGFFQVKTGSTFEVVTKDGTVRVLGTSFTVKQRNRFYEVICYEGEVEVQTSGQNVMLKAGDGYRNTTVGESRFQITPGRQPDWLHGRSSFFRTPFFVVLEELENQYEISIQTKNVVLNNTFTGTFPNDNLTMALDAVTIPSGYLYQVSGKKVEISGEKN